MKKNLVSFALMLILPVVFLHAQAFENGTNVLSAGIGLGSSIGYSGSSQSPAISLNFERGMWDLGSDGVVSIGAYAGFKGFKYSDSYYTQKWNYTIVGIRSAYHFTGLDNDQFDVYAGVMLSYNILKYKFEDKSGSNVYTGKNNYGSAAGFTAYAGGRYYFTSNLAVFAELGYGVSYFNAGLSLKF